MNAEDIHSVPFLNNILCWFCQLLTMLVDKIFESAFHILDALNDKGFSTYVTKE